MKESSWTCLLLRVAERKLSPGFTATKLLVDPIQHGQARVDSPLYFLIDSVFFFKSGIYLNFPPSLL